MSESIPDVLTIDEAAQYLRISKSSLYKLAQERKIPCQKVGRHWRFSRIALGAWLGESPPKSQPDSKSVIQMLS
jgi:excisionase family DNA binding protein